METDIQGQRPDSQQSRWHGLARFIILMGATTVGMKYASLPSGPFKSKEKWNPRLWISGQS